MTEIERREVGLSAYLNNCNALSQGSGKAYDIASELFF